MFHCVVLVALCIWLASAPNGQAVPGAEGFSKEAVSSGLSEDQAGENSEESPLAERSRKFPFAGRALRIDRTKEHPRLMDDSGSVLYYFDKSAAVLDSKAGESGTCLLLGVMAERQSAGDRRGLLTTAAMFCALSQSRRGK